MRSAWWVVMIAACSSSAAKPDALTPTSLVGSIACGSGSCSDNQLCVQASLDDSPLDTRCADAGSGCIVHDCGAFFRDCPGCNSCGCLAGFCEYYDGAGQMLVTMGVSGRDVGCELSSGP